MKIKNLLLSSVILLSLLHLTACSGQKNIVGKWQDVQGTESMEFFKDGTVTAKAGGMSLGGKYSFVDDERIKIELGGMGALAGPTIAKVAISGNELTLTDENDKPTKYRRVD